MKMSKVTLTVLAALLICSFVVLVDSVEFDVCRLPPEQGYCRGYFPKYYYDYDAGDCAQFIYGGCGGNANNFDTLEACRTACKI